MGHTRWSALFSRIVARAMCFHWWGVPAVFASRAQKSTLLGIMRQAFRVQWASTVRAMSNRVARCAMNAAETRKTL